SYPYWKYLRESRFQRRRRFDERSPIPNSQRKTRHRVVRDASMWLRVALFRLPRDERAPTSLRRDARKGRGFADHLPASPEIPERWQEFDEWQSRRRRRGRIRRVSAVCPAGCVPRWAKSQLYTCLDPA